MRLNIKELYPTYNFEIIGTSYAGNPKNNTAMFVTKKVQHLLFNLKNTTECLVFIEEGSIIPNGIVNNNAIISVKNPQFEYACFAEKLMKLREEEEQQYSYELTSGGYYLSSNAKIGKNTKIGPGCVIGHGVEIGDNAQIYPGCIIKHSIIGNDFVCNENAVIGSYSFTMANDEKGNKYRIPALGYVRIGNGVEIGANNNIACGTCGDTILEDYVKLDALIHIGHDSHLKKNVEITAGVTMSGFVNVGEAAYFGVGSLIRNRIDIGDNALIGMGAVVTKKVDNGLTMIGNPAHQLIK